MIEQLFKDVTDRLAAQVPALRWVDIDFGQLELPEDNYPLQFPCALVDFPNTVFMDETRGNQQGDVTVQVRIGLDLYEDYHIIDGTDAPQRDIAFKCLGIITDVHKALHCWEGDYFTPLTRTGLQTERRDDGIKVYTMLYTTEAKDDSAAFVYNVRTGIGLAINKGDN